MLKRIFAVCGLLAALVAFAVVPVSAAEVDSKAAVYEIKYPTWSEFEILRDELPEDVTVSGISYNLQNHIVVYYPASSYSSGNYAGYAKLMCFAFDPAYVSGFEHRSYFNWSVPDGVSESKSNVLMFVYDFDNYEWTYSGQWKENDRYWNSPPDVSNYIYADFDVSHKAGTNEILYSSGKLQGVVPPSWQTLTWDEMGNAGSDLMSEIFGILPVVIVFFVLSIAIHKGISFLIGFLRRV